MTRKKQKIEEQIYATQAAKLLNEDWQISEAEDELDWPDLLVKNGDIDFGLEVRLIFNDEKDKGSAIRESESKRNQQLARCAVEYYKTCSCPLMVRLYGDPSDPVKLAKHINKATCNLNEWERTRIQLDAQRWMYAIRLPDSFRQYMQWDLLSDSVGWVGKIRAKEIQEVINSKAKKLIKYKKHSPRVDLLIVCDHTKNSGKLKFDGVETLTPEGFNNVYLMNYPEKIFKFSA